MLSNSTFTLSGISGLPSLPLLALQDPPRPAGPAPASGGSGSGTTGAPAARPTGPDMFGGMLFPALIFGVMILFMLTTGRKQRKETETLQKSLQKGDRVLTSSGMIGTVVGLDDKHATLEISEKVRVKFVREHITRKYDEATALASVVATKK